MKSKLRDRKIYLLNALLLIVNHKKTGKYLSLYATDATIPSIITYCWFIEEFLYLKAPNLINFASV